MPPHEVTIIVVVVVCSVGHILVVCFRHKDRESIKIEAAASLKVKLALR